MTGAEMSQYIGRKGFYLVEGLRVAVSVLDVRHVYGQVQFRIRPEQGLGDKWTTEDKVQLVEV